MWSWRRAACLTLLGLVSGCGGGPASIAERLAASDPELKSRLAPAPGSWAHEAGALTSPGWRNGSVPSLDHVGARLPAKADGAIEVGLGQAEPFRLRLQPEHAAASTVEEEDGRATYRDAWPATDAIYVATPERLEWFLLLRDASAPTELAWQVTLPSGLPRARIEPSGALVFVDGGDNPRLRVPKPFARDANGTRRDAELRFEGGRLQVRLDTRGLKFPILLDPAIEAAVWVQRSPAQPPAARRGMGMVYDSVRQRVVLFGGTGSVEYGDTWEFDGTNWGLRSSTGPAPRSYVAMTYDSAHQLTVLFGGTNSFNGTPNYGDTWVWNGTIWTQVSASGPAARYASAMAYDSVRNLHVLYGGVTASVIADTWEFNATTNVWTNRGNTLPGARYEHEMAYDSVRQKTVMYGGYPSSGVVFNDTWEWNGTTWVQTAAVGPGGRAIHGMTFDSARGETIVFAGVGPSNIRVNDTWVYNGSPWVQIAAGGPSIRSTCGMAYDSTRGVSVMFGGWDGVTPNNETWELHTHGGACVSNAQCDGGLTCVDGVCCETSCPTSCKACNLAVSPGVCATVTNADDVDSCAGTCNSSGTCVAKLANGNTCTTNNLCTTGNCVDGYCCDSPCAGSCNACNGAALGWGGSNGVCTNAPVGYVGSPSCGGLNCDNTSGACPTCTLDSQCDATHYCSGGACLARKANGVSCGAADQCLTNFCVDGYCCNTLCAGACDVCSSTPGTCTLVNGGAGNPTCSPFVCNGSGASCPASCALDTDCAAAYFCNNSACVLKLAAGNNACTRAAMCSNGFCTDGYCCNTACGSSCDVCSAALGATANGTCTNAPAAYPGNPSCGGVNCSGTSASCATCTLDTQCTSGYFCNGTNCVLQLAQGGVCTRVQMCTSGFCADGYCCSSACGSSCDVCSTALGATSNGACTTAPSTYVGNPSCSPFLCSGGSTTCIATCTGDAQCAAADYCNAAGACVARKATALACNTAAGADCKVAGCRSCTSANCVDGFCCTTACAGACDACSTALGATANGTCTILAATAGGNPSCGPYTCTGTNNACAIQCAGDANCQAGNYCSSLQCLPKLPNGQPCAGVNQCTTGNCVTDPATFLWWTTSAWKQSVTNSAGWQNVGFNDSAWAAAFDQAAYNGAPWSGGNPFPAGSPARWLWSFDSRAANDFTTVYFRYVFTATTAAANLTIAGDNSYTVYLNGAQIGSGATWQVSSTIPLAFTVGNSYTLAVQVINSGGAGGVLAELGSGGSVCCDTACSGSCDVCSSTPGTGTCSTAAYGTVGSPTCSPYVCAGGSPSCRSTCTVNSDCGPGFFCSGTTCIAGAANGAACTIPQGCSSNNCTDGFCCDLPCSGACEVCAMSLGASANGTCTHFALGTAGSPSCAPYQCNGVLGSCPNPCVTDADCTAGYYCAANGTCKVQQAAAAACASDCKTTGCRQCVSGGTCKDGYCCESACAGPCLTCAAVHGSCTAVTNADDPDSCTGNTTCSAAGACRLKSARDCTTDVLNFTATSDASVATNNKSRYHRFSSLTRVVQAGDVLEYDTYLTSNIYGTGGFEMYNSDGSYYRDTPGWADQNGIGGHPGSDLTAFAYNQWYHRQLPLPASMVGKTINNFQLVAEYDSVSLTTTSYYDNVAITNGGAVVLLVWEKGAPTTNTLWGSTFFTSSTITNQAGPGAGGAGSCATGNCADGFCCSSACSGGCDVCSVTPGTCTAIASGSAGVNPSCSPFLCDGVGGSCPSTCTLDAQCVVGSFCNGSSCQALKGSGVACGGNHECTSTFCVDNVCCQSACAGACDVCSVTPGTCTLVAAGGAGNPVCGGSVCDGASASCPNTCATDSGCAAGYYCASNGTCQARRAQAATCDLIGDCKVSGCRECSGATTCKDGYCCGTACAGACQTCAAAPGTCTAVVGADDLDSCTGVNTCDPTGACWSKNGQGCAVGSTCASGSCADSVCCSTACAGGCDVCNVVPGTCTVVATGTPGANPSCAPFVCGGSATCPGSCAADTNCAAGTYCDGTTCQTLKSNGALCTLNHECATGSCADGVCCNTPCNGACDVCTTALGATSNGACTTAPLAYAGNPSCGAYACNGSSATCGTFCVSDSYCGAAYYCAANGTCQARRAQGQACNASAGADCLTGACRVCTSGNCVDGVCCQTACSGACDVCNVQPGMCTLLALGATGAPSCSPYLCTGASPTCGLGCTRDSDCITGNFCNAAGTCQTALAQGLGCNLAVDCKQAGACQECASGNCVDGYCCNSGCGGECDRCDGATKGVCAVLAQGAAGTPSCTPYLCTGTSAGCPASCTSDGNCAAGNFCGGGSCLGKKPLGSGCSAANECTSTFCADGVCCDAGCGGSCDSCNVAGHCAFVTGAGNPGCGAFLCSGSSANCPSGCTSDAQCAAAAYCAAGGTCQARKVQGQTCNNTDCAQAGCRECGTGFCTDGFCCEAACGGACESCSAMPGSCIVASLGAAGRPPSCAPYVCSGSTNACPMTCATDAACAAGYYCSGGSCVAKKARGQSCATANECTTTFCADSVCCNAACSGACDACDATGTCLNVTGSGNPSCGFYVCPGNSPSCPSSCTTDPQCASGYFCSSNACGAKRANGQVCTTANQCTSGNCADGFCCDQPCAGGCDVCNVTPGTCSVVIMGSSGANPSCGAQTCDGVSGNCPGGCSSDANCASTFYCNGAGQCAAQLAQGSVCARNRQCTSSNCVDSYCCNSACSGGCDVCNATAGSCTTLVAGSAGLGCGLYLCDGSSAACKITCASDTDCTSGNFCSGTNCVPALAQGQMCTRVRQCATGACADGYCCNAACGGGCDACDATPGVCTVRGAGATGVAPSCGAFLCNGSSGACPVSCAADADCGSSYFCNGGICTAQLGGGSACSTTRQCSSGFCVGNVCCSTACTGSCQTCGGGTCGDRPAGVSGTPSCAPYLCAGSGGGCPSSCTIDGNCASGSFCSGGACITKLANGQTCGGPNQCASGKCVDSYCCNADCTGNCDRCDVAGSLGTCTLVAAGGGGAPACTPYVCGGASAACPASCTMDAECASAYYCNGATCTAKHANGVGCSTAVECSSGFCADGVCCSSACGGTCDVCNAQPGTCTTPGGLPGSPTCAPYLCVAGSATCPNSCSADAQCAAGSFCNGTNCVPLQGSGSVCARGAQCTSGYCVDGVCCQTACAGGCDVCNVVPGSCTVVALHTAGSNPSCAPYLCDGTAGSCPNRCTIDDDCGGGYFCNSGTCTPTLGNASSCTSTRQCSSGFCVSNICCASACTGACQTCSAQPGTCTTSGGGAPGSPSCTPYLCNGASTSCPSTCSIDGNCINSSYCDAGNMCSSKQSNGQTCSGPNQCVSNHCVDGLCCNTACAGACDRCDVTGAEGTCSIVGAGAAGAPTCSPYVCSGITASCPGSCTTDTQCESTHFCSGGACVPKHVSGISCTLANQCLSGFCADGFCCNSACAGACDVCNATPGTCSTPGGAVGSPSCTPYLCAAGNAGCPTGCTTDGQCGAGFFCDGAACVPAQGNGLSCLRATQCTSGFCADGFCCNTACGGACDVCNATPGTCTLAVDGALGTPSCAPYVCDGAKATCPSLCVIDGDCSTGFFCNGGICTVALSNGASCARTTQCASGFCADNVCCGSGCNGACEACNLVGFAGSCRVVGAGATGAPSCAPYLCDGVSNACPSSCAVNGDCIPASYCTPADICNGKKPTGQSCTLASECTSNFCVDGFCCESACGGTCDTCAATPGTCTVAVAGQPGDPTCSPYACNGAQVSCPISCVADSNCATGFFCNVSTCMPVKLLGDSCQAKSECASGFCADGFCCDAGCTGACDRCDTTPGSCTPVAAGTPGSPSCAPYACGGASATCLTTCTGDGDCAVTSYCSGGTCVGKHVNGSACGGAGECASGSCVDNFCCNTACAGACDRCDSSPGTCTAVAAGSAGVPACAPFVCDGASPSCPTVCTQDSGCAAGLFCQAGACVTKLDLGAVCTRTAMCVSGSCADGFCCSSPCTGACNECASTPGTCMFNAAGAPGRPACTPYVCGGAASACPSGCTDDTNCVTGDFCNGGLCAPKLGLGALCGRAGQCGSGNCADGYCCDQACAGACDACNVTPGLCTTLSAGQPGAPACAPFACDGASAACPTTCTLSTQCAAGAFCAGGLCMTKQANGATCSDSSQCTSSICAGGTCCQSACSNACETCSNPGSLGACTPQLAGAVGLPACAPYACNGINRNCPNSCLTDGDCASANFCIFGSCTGKLPNSRPCGTATDCQSGNCIDGVCCNTPCTGDCDVCALAGSVGTCTKAPTDSDPRGACGARPGTGACKARCGSAGLCVYPAMTTACGPGSCVGGGTPSLLQQPAVCDGQGTCTARPVVDCAPYLCNGNACPSGCVDSTVCSGSNLCANATCGQHRALAAKCSLDADCDSQHCADGVCCASACTGACQRCDLPAAAGGAIDGQCRVPMGTDPDNDCPGEGVCHGFCRADRSCGFPGVDKSCDTCKACSGSGKCNQVPQSGDDPACMTVACGALSNDCRMFADLQAMRCVAVGSCAGSNDPSACMQFTNVNEGGACNGGSGSCVAGTCVPVADASAGDGSTEHKSGSGSCAMAPGPVSPAPLVLVLLAVLLALFRRRRS